MPVNTAFLLMAQYGGKAVIPLEDIRRDFFDHMSPEKMKRKVTTGALPLPVIRSEDSQKSWKGVHVMDLANYLDKQREAALKEFERMNPAR
jgi:hypothetical protein